MNPREPFRRRRGTFGQWVRQAKPTINATGMARFSTMPLVIRACSTRKRSMASWASVWGMVQERVFRWIRKRGPKIRTVRTMPMRRGRPKNLLALRTFQRITEATDLV
ncbi:hypothetical protein HMI54_003287, partial [Coelomomyces lativittatus]